MLVKIISIENSKTVFYTIESENDPNLYEMNISVKMIHAANEDCHDYHIGETKLPQIKNTIVAFHKLSGKQMPANDILKIAKDPSLAPFVKKVLEVRRKAPLDQDSGYAFIPSFSTN
jgi:hypothetical protein